MHVTCDTLVDPAAVVRRTMWVQYTLGRLECKDKDSRIGTIPLLPYFVCLWICVLSVYSTCMFVCL